MHSPPVEYGFDVVLDLRLTSEVEVVFVDGLAQVVHLVQGHVDVRSATMGEEIELCMQQVCVNTKIVSDFEGVVSVETRVFVQRFLDKVFIGG